IFVPAGGFLRRSGGNDRPEGFHTLRLTVGLFAYGCYLPYTTLLQLGDVRFVGLIVQPLRIAVLPSATGPAPGNSGVRLPGGPRLSLHKRPPSPPATRETARTGPR